MTCATNLKMWLTICTLMLAVVSAAAADIHYVNPGDSIQAAIDAADPGDQIEVAAGDYGEAIDFLGKAVRLYSSGGPDVTTIDATGKDTSVVSCKSGEGSGTILEGFTITGGSGTDNPLGFGRWGGGMYNYVSSPTVTNCIFSNNQAFAGGGMSNDTGSPIITNCTFAGNTADMGGGMFNGVANTTVTNCVFSGNSAPWGGAMTNYTASPTLTNCTISGNTGSTFCGLNNAAGSYPAVTNCIVWGNGWEFQPPIAYSEDSTVTIRYSDVQYGYEGTGNIDADPMFVGGGDYRLQESSPCIDTGDSSVVPADITTDLDGNPRLANNAVDMGAYEYPVALVPVGIDITPGSYPNALNINGNGVIPVAILGSAQFDVTQIVVDSLNFAGLKLRIKPNGVAQCSIADVSGPERVPDGYDDLVCQFVDDPSLWLPGDGFADLTGLFLSAASQVPFKGTDEITIVP